MPEPDKSPEAIRQQMTKLVLHNAEAIVQAAIEKAKAGHYSLTRLLFSLAGLYPAPGSSDARTDNSLAEFFLKQLGIAPPQSEDETTENQEHSLK